MPEARLKALISTHRRINSKNLIDSRTAAPDRVFIVKTNGQRRFDMTRGVFDTIAGARHQAFALVRAVIASTLFLLLVPAAASATAVPEILS